MDASFTDQTLHHLLSRTLRHSGSMHAHTRNSVAGVFYFLASPARHSRPHATQFALPHPSPRHSSLCCTRHLATVHSAAPVTSPQTAAHPAAGHQCAAPRQPAPRTRSCSAVKHSAARGRTCPAESPFPAYKRRCRVFFPARAIQCSLSLPAPLANPPLTRTESRPLARAVPGEGETHGSFSHQLHTSPS